MKYKRKLFRGPLVGASCGPFTDEGGVLFARARGPPGGPPRAGALREGLPLERAPPADGMPHTDFLIMACIEDIYVYVS